MREQKKLDTGKALIVRDGSFDDYTYANNPVTPAVPDFMKAPAKPCDHYSDYSFATRPTGPSVPEFIQPQKRTYGDHSFATNPKGSFVPKSLKPD